MKLSYKNFLIENLSFEKDGEFYSFLFRFRNFNFAVKCQTLKQHPILVSEVFIYLFIYFR